MTTSTLPPRISRTDLVHGLRVLASAASCLVDGAVHVRGDGAVNLYPDAATPTVSALVAALTGRSTRHWRGESGAQYVEITGTVAGRPVCLLMPAATT